MKMSEKYRECAEICRRKAMKWDEMAEFEEQVEKEQEKPKDLFEVVDYSMEIRKLEELIGRWRERTLALDDLIGLLVVKTCPRCGYKPDGTVGDLDKP